MECSIEGCLTKVFSGGYCQKHYTRLRRYGDPNFVKPRGRQKEDAVSLFWPKVVFPVYCDFLSLITPCWGWAAGHDWKGYPQFPTGVRRDDLGTDKAHRIAYLWFRGPLEADREIDHLCRNKGCLNPYHLELVTTRENTLRGNASSARNARKTHCKYGHVFDEQNTIWQGYHRVCRACRNRKQRDRAKNLPDLSAKAVSKVGNLRSLSIEDRVLMQYIENPETGCWLWQGFIGRGGYGRMSQARGLPPLSMHNWMYEHFVGPVPDGLVLDHLCRNRACGNPDHLEPKTNKANVLAGVGITAQKARNTHCPKGHPYDEENTYRDGGGYRRCRICNRERRVVWERARAAERKFRAPSYRQLNRCPKGHLYVEENVYFTKDGVRHCVACRDIRNEKVRQKSSSGR